MGQLLSSETIGVILTKTCDGYILEPNLGWIYS